MKIWFHNKVIWYLKQLLPLTYWTTFGEAGKQKVSIWKMWMGRCYDIKEYTVAD